ncbi:MAG: hypothetical protein IKE69_11620 [Thermoguttaceae bacterium]|nr:hypothetical protein [Thermoguttaceae bacterium]
MTDTYTLHQMYQCQRICELRKELSNLRRKIRGLARKENPESYVTDFAEWDNFTLRCCMQHIKGVFDSTYPSLQAKINHFAFCRDTVEQKLAKLGY